MDPNSLDVALLKENPAVLLLQYQQVIAVIVQVFMRSGYFQHESKEELIQYVNEALLDRMGKIRENYNGRALLRTYFSAVIKNICAELQRERQKSSFIQYFEEPVECENYETDPLSRMVIKQELSRLDTIFLLFGPLQSKVELCLKALYRIPLNKSDFNCSCKDPEAPMVKESIRYLMQPEPLMEKEVLLHLNILFNYRDGKITQSDALRKWVKARIREIVKLLNGNPARANYNEETLQILMERYYVEKSGLSVSYTHLTLPTILRV